MSVAQEPVANFYCGKCKKNEGKFSVPVKECTAFETKCSYGTRYMYKKVHDKCGATCTTFQAGSKRKAEEPAENAAEIPSK